MAKVEIRRRGGTTLFKELNRIPVAGDYVEASPLGRVLAVVLTPDENVDAIAFVERDQDGWPDEIRNLR